MANPYLQVDGLTKSFGDLVLFEKIIFGVADGQRIGLIAKNGSGKTTLLNILSGKEGYDEGSIVYRRDLRVGYLEQDPQYPEDLTVLEACFYHGTPVVQLIKEYEKCMETEGNPGLEDLLARMEQEKAWDYERKANQILSQLKIRNFDQQIKHLSGGQLKRGALANVLITEPDFLILDEPTNHLDLDMTEWLEDYLKRGSLSLLMVTHDRYFPRYPFFRIGQRCRRSLPKSSNRRNSCINGRLQRFSNRCMMLSLPTSHCDCRSVAWPPFRVHRKPLHDSEPCVHELVAYDASIPIPCDRGCLHVRFPN